MPAPYAHAAVCVDGSDAAALAVSELARLRPHVTRASVVHVVAPPSLPVSLAATLGGAAPLDETNEMEAARAWLESVATEVPDSTPVLLDGHPAKTVCDWARSEGCDLIIAASHSGLVERALLGSFAGYLAHHAPCPVLLVRPEAPDAQA